MPGACEGPGRRPEPAAVVGSTCSAGLSAGGVSAWRGLFPLGAAQAALAHVAGESPLRILGCRGEAQHPGGGQAASQHPQPRERRRLRQGVMLPSTLPAAQRQPRAPPAPCPPTLPPLPSAGCTLQHELPPAPQGVPAAVGLGQGLPVQQGACRSVSGAPGRRGGTGAVLSITLGSGSSEMEWRGSCRRYPKKVLERFSLRSFLRSSLSEVRGAGFGVGGASVLWSNCGW